MYRTTALIEPIDSALEPRAEYFGPLEDTIEYDPNWFKKFFIFSQYDWDDQTWNANNVGPYAFQPIPMAHDHFTIVSFHDYQKAVYLNEKLVSYHTKLARHRETGEIIGAYARRRGRAGELGHVSLHRILFDSPPGPVDHKNGWGLDNRRGTQDEPVNLKCVDYIENNHNPGRSHRRKDENRDLPIGVVRVGNRFRGKVCKRVGKSDKVHTHRSEPFDTAAEAHAWYLAKISEICQRKTFAHDPKSRNYPIFPPLRKIRTFVVVGGLDVETVDEDPPF